MKNISIKELALAFMVGFITGAVQSMLNTRGITNVLYFIIQGVVMGSVVTLWTWYILTEWRKKK